MDQIRLGQGLLIICCVFYLIWWGVAFHPNHGDSHTSEAISMGVFEFLTR